MSQEKEFVEKVYNCPHCKKIHAVKLPSNIAENRESYPFRHVFLHGELKELLTTLYIDKNLQIRGVEVHHLQDSDIFSKEYADQMINKLMDLILTLQKENEHLREQLSNLGV